MMQVKKILASLWILTLAATEIKGQCSKPTLMEKAVIHPHDVLVGVFDELSIVRLECIPGYEPPSTTPRALTCQKGQWKPTPDKFICQRKTCDSPGDLENGHYESPEGVEVGATIRAVCKSGYFMRGRNTRTCMEDGTWDGRDPMCVDMKTALPGQCSQPTLTEHAEIGLRDIMTDTFNDSDTVRLGCFPGYEPTPGSPRILTCEMGLWMPSPARFTCQKKSCSSPGAFGNGYYEFPEGVEFGATVKAVCKSGFYIVGQNTRTCLADGEWDGRQPVCEVVKCGPPPVVPNSEPSTKHEEYEYGQGVWYTCKEDYTLFGDSEPIDTVRCLENGTWSQGPRCVELNCLTPDIPNAILVEGGSGPYNYRSTVKYKCKEGYRLSSGSDRMVCLEDGWSSKVTCEEVTCPQPPRATNALIIRSPYVPYGYGDTFTYECQAGQRLVGSSQLTCGPDGQWLPDPPVCQDECRTPLGMESGDIRDDQLTASSTHYRMNMFPWSPHDARLNRKGSINAWSPAEDDLLPWLQVDLGKPKRVSGIITQGASSIGTIQYVSAFRVRYSNGSFNWKELKDPSTGLEKIFEGNMDNETPKENMFDSPVVARFVRFLPWKWEKHITVRMELLGCRDE